MIICFVFSKCIANAYSKCRIYTASLQRARGALTTRPRRSRRPHSVLSNTPWKRQAAAFVLSMLKVNAASWRSRRLHSVLTAFAQRCWRLHSAHLGVLHFFKRCVNAVRTPLWCDRGFNLTFTRSDPVSIRTIQSYEYFSFSFFKCKPFSCNKLDIVCLDNHWFRQAYCCISGC